MNGRMLLVIVLLAMLSAMFIYNNIDRSETVYPLNMQIISSEGNDMKFGISVDSELLNFGRMAEGSAAEKLVTIRNPENAPVKIHISSRGDISEYISFEKNDFVLNKNQEEKVYIRAEGRDEGNFTGSLTIMASTVGVGLMEWMVPLL